MATDRPNIALSAAVDEALVILQQHSRDAAARYLEQHGATFPLICRVLMEPARRRLVPELVPLAEAPGAHPRPAQPAPSRAA